MTSKVVSGVLWSQSVNPAFPNVNVSLNSSCQHTLCYGDWTYGEWTMELQRRVDSTIPPYYRWETIGSRTGYVSDDSPSHRTFTNVRKEGSIRVHTLIKKSAYHRSIILTSTVK